jgi:hypothetical protein
MSTNNTSSSKTISAVDDAIGLLRKRETELERAIAVASEELHRVRTAVRALSPDAVSPKRAPSVTGTGGTNSNGRKTVKAAVVELMGSDGSRSWTPAEISEGLNANGTVEGDRDGAVRTALWQLRREGRVATDSGGRTSLVTMTIPSTTPSNSASSTSPSADTASSNPVEPSMATTTTSIANGAADIPTYFGFSAETTSPSHGALV